MAQRTSLYPPTRDDSAETASDGAIEGFVGYNLKRVYMLIQSDFRATLGEGGLSPRVFSALSLVVERPGITQSDLARVLGIERSGLVAIVDALEALGYVQRKPVPGDRRVQALSPTSAGRRAFTTAVTAVQAHEAAFLSVLSSEQQADLLALLKSLRAHHEGGN